MTRSNHENLSAGKRGHSKSPVTKADKPWTKHDIYRTKPDIDRIKEGKTNASPRSNVRKCPLLSGIPGRRNRIPD